MPALPTPRLGRLLTLCLTITLTLAGFHYDLNFLTIHGRSREWDGLRTRGGEARGQLRTPELACSHGGSSSVNGGSSGGSSPRMMAAPCRAARPFCLCH